MDPIEGRGRNIDEAVMDALARTGLKREEVEVRVIQEGKQGLIGIIGGEDSVVEIIPRHLSGDLDDQGILNDVHDFIHNLIKMMDLDLDIDLKIDSDSIKVNLFGLDAAIAIGRHGDTLRAIEFLTVAVLSRRRKSRVFVSVDSEGYMEKRFHTVRALAVRNAERAIRTRREIELSPMSASERRIIHLALKDIRGVETFSRGDGIDRRVVISPL